MGSTGSMQAIILAAGKSSRFNTSKSKLSHTLCGQEMILYPVKLFKQLDIPVTLVLGYQKEALLEILEKQGFTQTDPKLPGRSTSAGNWVEQVNPQGTGHALMCSQESWHAENILVINGDMPLISPEIINQVIETHANTQAAITLVTTHNSDPELSGYGRVVRNPAHPEPVEGSSGPLTGQNYKHSIKIVEARDFTGDIERECCLNAGLYLIKRSFLDKFIQKLEKHTNSQEWYITDLIQAASSAGEKVETFDAPFDFVRGVNTLKELWIAEQIKRTQLIEQFMNTGVRFISPLTVNIDIDVKIGKNSVIGAGVQLRGKTVIGENCTIDAYSMISNSNIEHNSTVHAHCVISDSSLLTAAQVGPFAHIRNQSILEAESVIGNFVEVTKSQIGKKSKAKHLAYLGNSEIGAGVNIGAGTITCNYNGVSKHTTVIKDGAFVGSNSALCAPVTIGTGAIVGAGSVITNNIPDNALAIARAEQVTKLDYAPKLKEKLKNQKQKQQVTLAA